MLVLKRRMGQTIVIGPRDNPIAIIEVVDTQRGGVRLGIEADAAVPIHRGESLESSDGLTVEASHSQEPEGETHGPKSGTSTAN